MKYSLAPTDDLI